MGSAVNFMSVGLLFPNFIYQNFIYKGCGEERPCQRCVEKGLPCDQILSGLRVVSGPIPPVCINKRARNEGTFHGEASIPSHIFPVEISTTPALSSPQLSSLVIATPPVLLPHPPVFVSSPITSVPSLSFSDSPWLDSLLLSLDVEPQPQPTTNVPSPSPSMAMVPHIPADDTTPSLLALHQQLQELRDATDIRFRFLTAEINNLRHLRDRRETIPPPLRRAHNTWHTFPPLDFPLKPPASFIVSSSSSPVAVSLWSLPAMELLQCNDHLTQLLDTRAVDLNLLPLSFYSLIAEPFHGQIQKIIRHFDRENAFMAEFKVRRTTHNY